MMTDLPIRWEWDEDKNRENQRKHELPFEIARFVFNDPLFRMQPDPFPYEERWRTMGEVDGVVIIVIHTRAEPDYERGARIGRIISARPAVRSERNAYAEGTF